MNPSPLLGVAKRVENEKNITDDNDSNLERTKLLAAPHFALFSLAKLSYQCKRMTKCVIPDANSMRASQVSRAALSERAAAAAAPAAPLAGPAPVQVLLITVWREATRKYWSSDS